MKRGELCREGCKTRDHYTYIECMRAAAPVVNFKGVENRLWDRNIDAYRAARQEGLQPDSTNPRDIEVAKAFADKEGVAYDAGDKTGTLLKAKGYA